jgi:hypothetical protein
VTVILSHISLYARSLPSHVSTQYVKVLVAESHKLYVIQPSHYTKYYKDMMLYQIQHVFAFPSTNISCYNPISMTVEAPVAPVVGMEEHVRPQRFDMVVVMGAKMHEEVGPDGLLLYSYPPFEQYRDGRIVDGDVRARGMAVMWDQGLTSQFYVTGGEEADGRSRAHELIRHTHETYGVPMEAMIPLVSEPDSHGNIQAFAEVVKETARDEAELGGKRMAFLTNQSHVERTAAIALRNRDLAYAESWGLRVATLSAESLLVAAGAATYADVEQYYATPKMLGRILSESSGMRALKANDYRRSALGI